MVKRKSDWRPDYDMELIEKYRKRYPKKVREIEKKILKNNPRTNKDQLYRKVNKFILPPVLERPELDAVWGGEDVLQLSQVDEEIKIDEID